MQPNEPGTRDKAARAIQAHLEAIDALPGLKEVNQLDNYELVDLVLEQLPWGWARHEFEPLPPHPYPPFSGLDDDWIDNYGSPRCVKCGSHHVSASLTTRVNYGSEMVWHSTGADLDTKDIPKEWLRRVCRECGYVWPEMCRDAIPEPESERRDE